MNAPDTAPTQPGRAGPCGPGLPAARKAIGTIDGKVARRKNWHASWFITKHGSPQATVSASPERRIGETQSFL